MSNPALAMAYGVIGTILFNLSKGMQRQGIEAVSAIFGRRRRAWWGGRRRASAKSTALYVTGFVLNNSLGFFAILANRHAPAAYFTSMFGLGIIALMLYSRFILKEPTSRPQVAGAAVLALGTLVLGYDGILRQRLSMSGLQLPVFGVILLVTFFLVVGLLGWAQRRRSLIFMGVIYGIITGFAGSLDPVLKGIGQSLGGKEGYLPRISLGWFLFLLSFIFATLSFLASQWVFSRGVRASVLIPSQNFSYVVYPVVLLSVALPGFRVTGWTLAGLAVTCLGFVLMQVWTPKR